jgi:hypothetical protein
MTQLTPGTGDSVKPLRDLFAFLGLECPPDRRLFKVAQTHLDTLSGAKKTIAALREASGGDASRTWSAAQQKTITEMCGEMAATFGYDLKTD